jgi:hypothetical protein
MRLLWRIERTASPSVEGVTFVDDLEPTKCASLATVERKLVVIVCGRTPVKWHLYKRQYLDFSRLRDVLARKVCKVGRGQNFV